MKKKNKKMRQNLYILCFVLGFVFIYVCFHDKDNVIDNLPNYVIPGIDAQTDEIIYLYEDDNVDYESINDGSYRYTYSTDDNGNINDISMVHKIPELTDAVANVVENKIKQQKEFTITKMITAYEYNRQGEKLWSNGCSYEYKYYNTDDDEKDSDIKSQELEKGKSVYNVSFDDSLDFFNVFLASEGISLNIRDVTPLDSYVYYEYKSNSDSTIVDKYDVLLSNLKKTVAVSNVDFMSGCRLNKYENVQDVRMESAFCKWNLTTSENNIVELYVIYQIHYYD